MDILFNQKIGRHEYHDVISTKFQGGTNTDDVGPIGKNNFPHPWFGVIN